MITAATPNELRKSLLETFPKFQDEWEEDENSQSLHHVMGHFADFFGKHSHSMSDKQLIALGLFINKVVIHSDGIENAVSTCFLEHLHQLDPEHVMRPYLSKEAKKKGHA